MKRERERERERERGSLGVETVVSVNKPVAHGHSFLFLSLEYARQNQVLAL